SKENPGLQVGLHLTLVQGHAALPHPGFPTIIDRAGDFTNDPVYAGMRYFFLKSLKTKLCREIEGQIQKFIGTGIPLSHIDGHLNIHMHPVVFDILVGLMPRYGIRSFRLTSERLMDNLAVDRRRMAGKAVDAFIFSSLARRCRPQLDRLAVSYATEVKGLLSSGSMTEAYLLKALDALACGVTEIYFHPGCLPCSELTKRMPDYHHEEELAALTSPRVKEKLTDLGIKLRNYRGEEKRFEARG
ncbi:MAG: hypothetical protein FD174_3912, partial [Geobacteraceae bacterium]